MFFSFLSIENNIEKLIGFPLSYFITLFLNRKKRRGPTVKRKRSFVGGHSRVAPRVRRLTTPNLHELGDRRPHTHANWILVVYLSNRASGYADVGLLTCGPTCVWKGRKIKENPEVGFPNLNRLNAEEIYQSFSCNFSRSRPIHKQVPISILSLSLSVIGYWFAGLISYSDSFNWKKGYFPQDHEF